MFLFWIWDLGFILPACRQGRDFEFWILDLAGDFGDLQ